jgi:hypothetical protein
MNTQNSENIENERARARERERPDEQVGAIVTMGRRSQKVLIWTRPIASTYVSIRQHTSAYVSWRASRRNGNNGSKESKGFDINTSYHLCVCVMYLSTKHANTTNISSFIRYVCTYTWMHARRHTKTHEKHTTRTQTHTQTHTHTRDTYSILQPESRAWHEYP